MSVRPPMKTVKGRERYEKNGSEDVVPVMLEEFNTEKFKSNHPNILPIPFLVISLFHP